MLSSIKYPMRAFCHLGCTFLPRRHLEVQVEALAHAAVDCAQSLLHCEQSAEGWHDCARLLLLAPAELDRCFEVGDVAARLQAFGGEQLGACAALVREANVLV